jgi:hypothetical protein
MQPDDRAQWVDALDALTATREAARAWQETRYRYAHAVGRALVDRAPAVTGHCVYGVFLSWELLYVGRTSRAERRMKDLAVGESHHLANSFPPEIWHRVGLVCWPKLPSAQALPADLDHETVGLALEHRLQAEFDPVFNAFRRTTDGGWRAVDLTRSRSRGALASAAVENLYDEVRVLWRRLHDDPRDAHAEDAVRWVAPRQLGATHESSEAG